MNRKMFYTTSMVAAAMFATGAVAMAQSQPGTTAPPSTKERSTQQQTQARSQQKAPVLKRVSELTGKLAMGTSVLGSDNKKIGDIHHFAIDMNSGKVPFAVVTSGGVAGIGGDWYVVPMKALSFSELNDTAQLKMTATELESMPKVNDDNWNQLNEENWRNETYRKYKVEIDVDVDRDRDGTRTTTTTKEIEKTEKEADKSKVKGSMNLVRSDKVIGMDVTNPGDDDLGEVNDLVINLTQSRIAYTVLGLGGFLGMGERLFAVPWQALDLSTDEKQFVISLDRERLREAPGFDNNQWPDLDDLNWNRDVHAFYGTEPDWVYGFEGQGNTNNVDRDRSQSRGWETNSEYNRMFKAGDVDTFTGTIASVDKNATMKNMSNGCVIHLRTNEGETIPVHLGPSWYIEQQQNARFNTGDQVTVTGARCNYDGKECIMATEVRHNNFTLKLRDKDGKPAWDSSRDSDR